MDYRLPDFEEDIKIKGMPLRSQYNIRKQEYDSNSYLDFDINNSTKSTLNVDPNESNGGIGANIQTSMTKITSQLNPQNICSKNIDELNNTLFNYLYPLLNNSFIINGFALLNLFGALYLISSTTSEIELKTFFNFTKKDVVYAGLKKLNYFIESNNNIKMKNFMIVGNDVSYNPKIYSNIKDFCILLRPDISKIEEETYKMNLIINKMMDTQMKNPITPENLFNTQLMLLNTTVIHPIWESPFDQVLNGVFNNNIHVNYLYSVGKPFGYFEDGENQMLEIKCVDKLIMGILLSKSNSLINIDENKLHFNISQMKESVLDEVKIPMFKKDLKIRYNSSLKNLGIRTIFMKFIAPEMFPEGVQLQDVIQNVKIIIDTNHNKSNEHVRGYRTIRKILCTKQFVYYFRLGETILLIGLYNG